MSLITVNPKSRILLVEDDPSLGETLFERLQKSYQIEWARTFKQAYEKILSHPYDLLILDVGLPDGTGFEIAEKVMQDPVLKNRRAEISFLFLTAQSDAESRLKGFELGAEEFIPKPFHLKELLIRIEHVLNNHKKNRSVYKAGGLEIYFDQNRLQFDSGESVSLSQSETKMLQLLIDESPKVLPRDQILDHVWGVDKEVSHRTIDNLIVKLRSALKNQGAWIKSHRGQGYQWDPVEFTTGIEKK